MTKYAQAAIETVRKNQGKASPDMRLEWEKTMMEFFPTQEASRKKGCPKNAFLGLCEDGYIIDIPKGDYGVKKGSLNKGYATKAANLALKGLTNEKELWAIVASADKRPNSQMSIVLALLNANMLRS